MERLICSSPLPSKLYLKPFPSLPQLGRLDPRKLGVLLSPTTESSFRVNSSSSLKRVKFQLRASSFSNQIHEFSVNSSLEPSYSNGSSSEPRLISNPSHINSKLQKVWFFSLLIMESLVLDLITLFSFFFELMIFLVSFFFGLFSIIYLMVCLIWWKFIKWFIWIMVLSNQFWKFGC